MTDRFAWQSSEEVVFNIAKQKASPSMQRAFDLAKKHGFPAEKIRFSPKLEWVADKRGKMVLRKLRVDPKTKVVTIFNEAIEANYKDAEQHTVEILDIALKFLGNGEWDEEEHPRDSNGKFTHSGGAGGIGDSGDTGEGFGGGLVLPEGDKPAGGSSEPKAKVKVKPEDFTKDKINLKVGRDVSKFIAKWDERVGTTPSDFTNNFLGGTKADEVTIAVSGDTWTISGKLLSDNGAEIGKFTREIDFTANKADSAYLSLNSSARNENTGKQILAGNVEMYKKLGMTQVSVYANLTVGGYAWAKYGYVPTQSSWDEIRRDVIDSLAGGRRSSPSTSTYTPESWDEIGEGDRDHIRERWLSLSYSDFESSEIDSWRESGEARHQAKQSLANDFNDDKPVWAIEAIDSVREELADDDIKIPYTNDQLFNAIEFAYDDQDYDGQGDPDIEFIDGKLNEPDPKIAPAFSADQPTLPGIEPLEPHQALTEDMRDRLNSALTDAFNKEAEDREDEESPDDHYIRERAEESAESYWDDALDDESRFREADRHGLLPEVEIENEDEEDLPDTSDTPEDEKALLTRLAQNRDPKTIWAIADSSYGKQLLLGKDWNGVLKFNDAEAMTRFEAYVSRSKKKKAA